MDLPLNTEVHCLDGPCGRSTTVIVHPLTRCVTHLVVQPKGFGHSERMVPINLIRESTPNVIRLYCSKKDFAAQEPFNDVPFVLANDYWMDDIYMLEGGYVFWPYVQQAEQTFPMPHIPPGELAIHRGAKVQASDGQEVGEVQAFLVSPGDGRITHLILRKGHLWGKKNVTIPLSNIERIEQDQVFLTVDKRTIAALPHIRAVKRRDSK